MTVTLAVAVLFVAFVSPEFATVAVLVRVPIAAFAAAWTVSTIAG